MPTDRVPQSVGGIVLCGGRSSRMGRSKMSLPFGNELMLIRVVRILQTVVRPVVVVAALHQEVPTLPAGVLVVRDEEEFLGPLAGIAAGLEMLGDDVEAAFVAPCDVPLLKSEFIAEVIDHLGGHEIAVPKDKEFHHPLAAVYRTSLAERARQLVASGERRLMSLIQISDAVEIPTDELRAVDCELQSLRNLNQMSDYESALRDAGLWETSPAATMG